VYAPTELYPPILVRDPFAPLLISAVHPLSGVALEYHPIPYRIWLPSGSEATKETVISCPTETSLGQVKVGTEGGLLVVVPIVKGYGKLCLGIFAIYGGWIVVSKFPARLSAEPWKSIIGMLFP
jgi:hypothetical protein